MLIMIDDQVINMDYVVAVDRLAPSDRGLQRCRVGLATGGNLTVGRSIDFFERLTGAILSAPPGYSAVRAYMPAKGDTDQAIYYSGSPVLAFRYAGEGDLPLAIITPEGSAEAGEHLVIVRPDGSCFNFDSDWDSVDAWKLALAAPG